jgi:penicillin-binding protein 1B
VPGRLRSRPSAIRQFARQKWVRVGVAILSPPLMLILAFAVYSYVTTARLMDAQLHGERQRVLPRILARPLELRRGQSLSNLQLIDRLNDLGYSQRAVPAKPGEFAAGSAVVEILPRAAELNGKIVRVRFQQPAVVRRASGRPPPRPPDRVERLELGTQARDQLTLDAPVLSSMLADREKRRPVALSAIPPDVVQAVLAIEDRRFYEHPGVDPIGIAGATFSYMTGRRAYLAGGSTITQQLVRNVFLPKFEGMTLKMARERSWRRKVLEAWVSLVLSRRATKDEILEIYLNAVPLGQRGSFAIAGVSEAARLFFGKDVSNLSLPEAATIAGIIQSPSALSPFNNLERCRDRRNVVLHAMVDAGYITDEAASEAANTPLTIVQRALESEAPHFVDFVGRMLTEEYPGLMANTAQPVDVYTTLDLHLQRLADDAVRNGLAGVDRILERRKRRGRAEAALISVDPRTGEILAMVGGRSYNQSQYNRALVARRQPGSVFKPFVYLTAFEEAAEKGQTDITPASIVDDSPATWEFDDQVWTPENYQQEYDGPTTYRHALAHSRNVATIRVAEGAGYDKVAALWKRLRVGNPPRAFPSIALGVFEATPYEVAEAYTIFPNMGIERPLLPIMRIQRGAKDVTRKPKEQPRTVTRADATFLVTDMLRSVINEGTGSAARTAGFRLDAGGKTGTTNDLRDAWFVGFTPELLTVVWVGFDDNQPVGLTGAQAALPIWTQFMIRALAGRTSVPFTTPDGIGFADIDATTGQLATPRCPKVITESFLAGTEPTEICSLHRFE